MSATVTVQVGDEVEATEETLAIAKSWEGVLAVEDSPTADKRVLMSAEMSEREMPLPFCVQIVTDEGHKGSEVAGCIESLARVPLAEFDDERFDLSGEREGAVVVWGEGVLDGSPAALEGERLLKNGCGVSVDVPHDRLALLDPETLAEVDPEQVDLFDVLSGKYLTGIAGKYAGATIVTVPAVEPAKVLISDGRALVASAYPLQLRPEVTLVAAAAPLKPPRAWFDDQRLKQLTPLTITEEGQIYGHLADWDGCHTGFTNVCVPPFRSKTNYAYFNTRPIQTAEGDDVWCGKLMFSMDGGKHAPVDPRMSWQGAAQHYDDSTCVGGYVRAGSDRLGTWLAGALRHGLTEEEVQHLRTHGPSGDWRPIPGKGTELVAAFAVPVQGFPIPLAFVASGAAGELTIITAPLVVGPLGERSLSRRKRMLHDRAHELLSK